MRALRGRRATGIWGACALAASVAVCPFYMPALVVLPGVSASVGSIAFGALLPLAFAFGRGVVPILAGLYMLNAFFILIPALAV